MQTIRSSQYPIRSELVEIAQAPAPESLEIKRRCIEKHLRPHRHTSQEQFAKWCFIEVLCNPPKSFIHGCADGSFWSLPNDIPVSNIPQKLIFFILGWYEREKYAAVGKLLGCIGNLPRSSFRSKIQKTLFVDSIPILVARNKKNRFSKN